MISDIPNELLRLILSFLHFGVDIVSVACTSKSIFYQIQSFETLFDFSKNPSKAKNYLDCKLPNLAFDLFKNQRSQWFAPDVQLNSVVGIGIDFTKQIEQVLTQLNPAIMLHMLISNLPSIELFSSFTRLKWLKCDHPRNDFDPFTFQSLDSLEVLELSSSLQGEVHLPPNLVRFSFCGYDETEFIPHFHTNLKQFALTTAVVSWVELLPFLEQFTVLEFNLVDILHFNAKPRMFPNLETIKLFGQLSLDFTGVHFPKLSRFELSLSNHEILEPLFNVETLKCVVIHSDPDCEMDSLVFTKFLLRLEINLCKGEVSPEVISMLPQTTTHLTFNASEGVVDVSSLTNLVELEIWFEQGIYVTLPPHLTKLTLVWRGSFWFQVRGTLEEAFKRNPQLKQCVIKDFFQKMFMESDLYTIEIGNFHSLTKRKVKV